MAYVYIRNDDSVVVAVKDYSIDTPANHTMYESQWDRNLRWTSYKIIRNSDGSYYDSQINHPDDNDGLF
jgi:hypothetical protein